MGARTPQEFHFADFKLDQARYRLERGEHRVRLEKLPMELLILLLERCGELVSRDEIAERLWGKDVFVDVDHSINIAVRKIRVALRDDPEMPRFVETVIGKGYRFAASVSCGNGDVAPQLQALQPSVKSELPSDRAAERVPPARRLRTVLAGLAVLALLEGALIFTGRWRGKGTVQPAIRRLAVLPLKNLSGDPTQEYFADGMTEELIGRLSMIRELRVVSRTSAMRFKDTKMSLPEIAAVLHVDAVVEGSVIRDGKRIRVHAQLIRATTDEHFWSETYDRDLEGALALQSEVAQAIAQKVEVTLTGSERARLAAKRHIEPEVYENYLKGLFIIDKNNSKAVIQEGIGYFEAAINKDPTFAPAYVELAAAYDGLGTIFVGASPDETRPKVMRAARKALDLDPGIAKAHVLLAELQQEQWHWSEAEAEFRQALELNPNDAVAHLGLAHWLVCQGRMDEALALAQRGRELDPFAVTGVDVGWILFASRRYDEAILELRSVLAVRADNPGALWYLGFALIGKGQSEEAIPVLEKLVSLMERSPGSLELLATAYAYAGHRADAIRLLNELKARRRTNYVPAGALINPNLALGDYDQTFFWFERAFEEKSNIMQFLKVQPFFDPVRGDPRFQDLVRRVGLN